MQPKVDIFKIEGKKILHREELDCGTRYKTHLRPRSWLNKRKQRFYLKEKRKKKTSGMLFVLFFKYRNELHRTLH